MNKVITGKVRASYPSLFEPKSINGSNPKFSIELIVSKNDTVTVGKMKEAIKNAIEEGISKRWNGKRPANLGIPLHDGDAERSDNPNYANSFYISATSVDKPGVVDRKRLPITDPQKIYPGCYVRASLNFYAYNANGMKKGVACGLQNVQFWCDGEPLNGRVKAEDEFDSLDDDDFDDFADGAGQSSYGQDDDDFLA